MLLPVVALAFLAQVAPPISPAYQASHLRPSPVAVETAADAEFRGHAVAVDTPGVTAPVIAVIDQPGPPAVAMIVRTESGTGMEGVVGVEVVIGTDGRVERARALQSPDSTHAFDQSALVFARRWQFRPATLNGAPVESYCEIAIDFFR